VSWFRSSRRRRSQEQAEAPAGPPRPARGDLEDRPLADLHQLAAEWSVPRFRLLRREQLVEAISGEPAPVAPAAVRSAPVAERKPAAVRRAPVADPEPEPVQEPEPDGEVEYRSGVLDLVGEGYGFLRVDRLTRSPDDPYVSRALVQQYSLRRGDEVAGNVVSRRAGERHARLVTVDSRDEGESPPEPFDERPAHRPSRPLRPPAGTNSLPARMAELIAPLAAGQRALVAGPPGAGATRLMRDLTRALIGGDERLIVVLVDVRPEEVSDWDLPDSVEVHAAPSDLPPRQQLALAELALERAKRLAEREEDVVVVIDSISRLARAYGLARARRGDDAPTPELLAVEGAKRWFGSARETGAGSVTLLAAARVESESPLESLVHESLLDTAGAVVRLDAELAARGLYPAIDMRRSRTLGEEALVAESQRAQLDALRGVLRSLDPVAAWEFAAERVRESSSNDELLERDRF
jgi:transcription termination factor Rho